MTLKKRIEKIKRAFFSTAASVEMEHTLQTFVLAGRSATDPEQEKKKPRDVN